MSIENLWNFIQISESEMAMPNSILFYVHSVFLPMFFYIRLKQVMNIFAKISWTYLKHRFLKNIALVFPSYMLFFCRKNEETSFLLLLQRMYYFHLYLQDTLKEFLQKKESGELLYQKRTKLEKTIFKKVRIKNFI